MPRKLGSPGGALSAVGTAKNFINIMREISFDDEREQAERMPRVLVLAPDVPTAQRIGDAVTGTTDSPAVTTWTLDAAGRSTEPYDIVIVYNRSSNAAFIKLRDNAGADGLKVFDLALIDGENSRWAEELRLRVCDRLPNKAPAFGRWFTPFRPAATRAVIDDTAKANAQFALVSNAPAAIPILGSLIAVGADFFVLTKNQVMMVFKIAAINGRDLTDQWKIIRELTPVVGAGFLWRTLAREASSFIPFLAGTLPKVLIAYTGTVAAGRGADFYYQFGQKPTSEQLKGFYDQALESIRSLPFPGMGGKDQTGARTSVDEESTAGK